MTWNTQAKDRTCRRSRRTRNNDNIAIGSASAVPVSRIGPQWKTASYVGGGGAGIPLIATTGPK